MSGALYLVVAQQGAYGGANEWSYVLTGWGLVTGGVALYAAMVLRKGRQLAKRLPPKDRRWMS